VHTSLSMMLLVHDAQTGGRRREAAGPRRP